MAIGIAVNALSTYGMITSNYDIVATMFWNTPYQIGRVAVALGHASLLILLVKGARMRWLTDRLAAVGQMAFSNYISHSIIYALVFYAPGLRMFGQLQRYQLYYVVLGIWILNLAWSPIWLRYFRFGPLEWCWRSLTYWQRQPMRRRPRRLRKPTRWDRAYRHVNARRARKNRSVAAVIAQRIGPVDILALARADRAIAAEHRARVFEAEQRPPGRAAERVRQHAAAVAEHEARDRAGSAAGMCRTFIQRSAFHRMNSMSSADEVRAARDGGGAVVLLDAAIDDEAALDEITRHRRARVRRRMLDVRPVDVLSRERQVGVDGLRACRRGCRRSARRRRTCRGGGGRRPRPCVALPTRRPCSRWLFFARGLQEGEIVVEDVLDAQEHVAEAGLLHQRRQRLRRARRSARSSPAPGSRRR